MKKLFGCVLTVVAVVMVCQAAPRLWQTRPFGVSATNREPSFEGVGPTGGTNDLLKLRLGLATKFLVPSNGVPTFVNAGSTVTTANGTVTQAFTYPYTSSVPVVIVRQRGLNTTITNVVETTGSNFVLRTGLPTQTNDWIAVGAP